MSAFSNKRPNDGDGDEPSSKNQKTGASSVNDVDVKQIMTSEGPIVSCVMLRANGKQEQLQLDTSPRKRQAEEFLGAACTMLGEWSDQQVVLIARQDYETEGNSAAPLSTHKLQPPFHAFKVHGDILLMKLGEDSLPLNYTLKEYEAFQALEIEEWEIEEEDDDEEEDDEEEEGGDGDGVSGDEEEDDSEAFAEHLFMQLVEKFKKEHGGRAPTEAQLKELEVQVGQMIEEMAGGDDDEDDDSGDDDEDEDNDDDDDDEDDEEDDDEEEDDE